MTAGLPPAAPRPPSVLVERAAAYQNGHEIPGIFALDDEALVIEVLRPSPDFVNMLALGCASPAPVECDAFLPGTQELTRNLPSNGPYRVTGYVPGEVLRLEPNPVWSQESDPIRHRHLRAFEVTVADIDADEIAARLDAGRADLPWGLPLGGRSKRDAVEPLGALSWDLDPYLVFNLVTGNAALGDVRVRHGIAAAIDKAALMSLCRDHADSAHLRVADSAVPPNNDGHRNAAEDGDQGGDPQLARELLSAAGCPSGLALTAVYERQPLHEQAIRACAAGVSPVRV